MTCKTWIKETQKDPSKNVWKLTITLEENHEMYINLPNQEALKQQSE